MVDSGFKGEFGRFEGVFLRESDVEEEDATSVSLRRKKERERENREDEQGN